MDERNEAAKKAHQPMEPNLLKADLMLLKQMMQFEPYAPYPNLDNFWLNLGFEIPKIVARKAITKPEQSTEPQINTIAATTSGTEEN